MNTLSPLGVFGQGALAKAGQPRLDQTVVRPPSASAPDLPFGQAVPASTASAANGTQTPGGGAQEGSLREQTAEAVKRARELAQALDLQIPSASKLTIRRDQDAGRFVYEFRDPKTDEVVQQFPAEKVLAALQAARQSSSGFVVDDTA